MVAMATVFPHSFTTIHTVVGIDLHTPRFLTHLSYLSNQCQVCCDRCVPTSLASLTCNISTWTGDYAILVPHLYCV